MSLYKQIFQTDGNLDFAGSSVTEPSKIEGNDDFIAHPDFVLQTDGQLRLVNCTCTVFKDQEIRNRLGWRKSLCSSSSIVVDLL